MVMWHDTSKSRFIPSWMKWWHSFRTHDKRSKQAQVKRHVSRDLKYGQEEWLADKYADLAAIATVDPDITAAHVYMVRAHRDWERGLLTDDELRLYYSR